ncbi:hypothetical protein FE391_33640 [Nonomuraea sp. KC401]|uniref:hypothetical protein n=1 Tax=unclassified Nonomuraea TaxID=2593643 RepID=UPI0010FD87CA|nr:MULTISPECIES: hypothetical protein [unclassified Nonomuraea]NBE98114.1 hypothetical protein [Nonomuraea sp. K271]TLF60420.1 hypothetical protein FE391_33640 [Nonomuraea sp. KC401]
MAVTFRPALGQLYDPMREQLPKAMTWRLSPQDVELLIAVPGPTAEEVAATHGRLGRARFAFIERPNVLVLCHRFGTGGWGAQPWQAVRQDHPDLYPPGLPAAERFPIHVYLADSRTGRVLAHGLTSWPQEFVAPLQEAIERHVAGPQDDAAAGVELEELLQLYPDSGQLVRDRAPFTCTATLVSAP